MDSQSRYPDFTDLLEADKADDVPNQQDDPALEAKPDEVFGINIEGSSVPFDTSGASATILARRGDRLESTIRYIMRPRERSRGRRRCHFPRIRAGSWQGRYAV